jgi:hypothetical protein
MKKYDPREVEAEITQIEQAVRALEDMDVISYDESSDALLWLSDIRATYVDSR